MKRMIYAVVAASAFGLAATGVALACEQTQASNAQGAGAQRTTLAMLGVAAPQAGTVRDDDDDNKSAGGDTKSSGDDKSGDDDSK